MSLTEKDGYDYTDGGVMENEPIQEAIDRGATEIDVILLRAEEDNYKIERIRNAFHWVVKLGDLQHYGVNNNEVTLPKLRVVDDDVKLNIYYTPRVLTNNPLIFDSEVMSDWWTEGHEYANTEHFKGYLLSKGRKPKLVYSP